MEDDPGRNELLEARIRALEAENARLRAGLFSRVHADTVRVPEPMQPLFRAAEDTVGAYFRDFVADPSQGTIEIAGERYLLIRASALSYGFLNAVRSLYADRGDAEAMHIGKTLLFDIAHVLGINDARNFHQKMGLESPIAKLSAGPVHFAYSGWAFVEILPDCRPTLDDDFFLHYHHPFSFESDSWLRAGESTEFAVCIMNAGYSSGWCQESFGIPLTAAEVACKAKGDENCTFVMSPPHRLRDYVADALSASPEDERRKAIYDIPTLFERRHIEERLHRALARAEASNAAKSLFLANMSHEIRTPLTGMLGMTKLVLKEDLSSEQRRNVDMINQSGEALLHILNDILDLSKIEAGMMSVSLAPCDVRAVLGEVADVLRARIEDKGLGFALEIEEALPPHVTTDAMRLRQIVMNLAGNAVKFTPEGHVTIRARWTDPDRLHVEVEDTGIGIPDQDISRLFEAFTQADVSHSRRFSGTGLGLNIARQLVKIMDGTIDATSEEGRGSTFYFTLPAPRADDPARAEAPTEVPPLQIDAHVLLVEDDRIARFVAERLLLEQGCRVDTAQDGGEAVAAVTAGSYDLVLMDCQMPVMDGYEAAARIRRLEGTGRRTPIVALTASVMQGQGERCAASGMDDYLGKPLDAARLQAVLSRWVKPEGDT